MTTKADVAGKLYDMGAMAFRLQLEDIDLAYMECRADEGNPVSPEKEITNRKDDEYMAAVGEMLKVLETGNASLRIVYRRLMRNAIDLEQPKHDLEHGDRLLQLRLDHVNEVLVDTLSARVVVRKDGRYFLMANGRLIFDDGQWDEHCFLTEKEWEKYGY